MGPQNIIENNIVYRQNVESTIRSVEVSKWLKHATINKQFLSLRVYERAHGSGAISRTLIGSG